jgi:hypothetical protein
LTSDGFLRPADVLAVLGLPSTKLPFNFAADTLFLAVNAVGLFRPVDAFASAAAVDAVDYLELFRGLRATLPGFFESFESVLFLSATVPRFNLDFACSTLRAVLAAPPSALVVGLAVVDLGSVLGALEGTTLARL